MAHSPIVDQQLAVFPGNHLRDKKEHNKINQLNLWFSCLGALTLGPLLFSIYINDLPNCLLNCQPRMCQRAKKVLSDSPGLVDFAIGLVNSVFNLPDGQVMFYEEFE